MKQSLFQVTIEGISPLLISAWPMEGERQNGSSMQGQKPLPKEEATGRLYARADGTPYFPGPNLYSALIAAGIFQKVGKRQLTTGKSSLIPGTLMLCEAELVIDPSTWEVDSRPIVNAQGSRTTVHRPRFDKWRLQFTLDADLDEISETVVRRLVDDAGRKIGIGAFRPQRKGPFGRFVVVSWKAAA